MRPCLDKVALQYNTFLTHFASEQNAQLRKQFTFIITFIIIFFISPTLLSAPVKPIFEQTALLNAIAAFAFLPKPVAIKKSNSPRLTKKNPSQQKKYFLVIIDPGHGGGDTGALGLHGIAEKNVVLAIAKKLMKEINRDTGMRAILTRDGDYFVPLRQRLKMARNYHADIFIAIHADAYFDKKAYGASVYALSQRGATSEAARWLAQRDNYAELGEVALDTLQDRSPLLRSVLIDLAQTATIQASLCLGNRTLKALNVVSSLHYTHVEQAPFVVLKSPDIPSILVETGFISNGQEAQRLINASYQNKIAQALWKGVTQYRRKLCYG